ncbi:FumA C-terminus/TtdB family hydratase beta subunit [Brevibacterium spongiae]|uniref:Fumarate hydratase class I n=2 Tax=Brevibacterium spongiae TaxID=2909672 RepID=A0ABY5STU1_9MICO|nr:FumA C-terminus/TtdB family hydratase beta subunit [Brevibacterium spongiae]UVI37988.1 FumA C-terminus/TtdB family hydratase beta subunit [Brevibacterium spongiae]
MRRLEIRGVETTTAEVAGTSRTFLTVAPETLSDLAEVAFKEISHYLRTDHLASLRAIIDDPEASENDVYVALDLLQNAAVSAGEILPMCQDTGTAIVSAKRGPNVLTDGDDAKHLSRGIGRAYEELNLRYSQLAPTSLFEESNTGTNLPAQIEVALSPTDDYELLFMAKGGGSANKSFLYQETKAVLNESSMLEFLADKISTLGTAACPPYHLAVVIGGPSAEFTLKTAKLASAHYLDDLPEAGDAELGHGFRDKQFEETVFELTQNLGFGAQFGGKYFCHDVRVVRLPRHNGSLPIAIAVSCSADRQIIARINADGVFIEELEHDPARFLPSMGRVEEIESGNVTDIDLDRPMSDLQAQLSELSVGDRVSLTGTMIVARDIVHANLRDRLGACEDLPDYVKDHPIYYAGPAKTPEGMPSGSFGPTTSSRMDTYVRELQAAGGSMIMLGKGNRSAQVKNSCAEFGGFYLGSIGGPAARLAQDCITSVEVLDMEELGMEAVWKIEVEDFPAFIITDDKGNDFFDTTEPPTLGLGRTRTVRDGTRLD